MKRKSFDVSDYLVDVDVTSVVIEVSTVRNTVLDGCGAMTRGQYTKNREFYYFGLSGCKQQKLTPTSLNNKRKLL